MKKAGIYLAGVILGCFIISLEASGAETDYYSKYFRTDSALVFNWNATTSSWDPSSVVLYNYNGGQISNILTINYLTRAAQARTDYHYNANKLLDTLTNYYFSGTWIKLTRNILFYDSQNRVSEIDVEKWANSAWGPNRIQNNYQYDEFNRQVVFEAVFWNNNSWTAHMIDSSYYDQEGKLIKRDAFYDNGNIDYKIVYNYNIYDLLSEAYSGYPSSTGWTNLWLVDYVYNNCGRIVSQVQSSGTSTGWLPGTKTVFFSHFQSEKFPYRKVPICYKGRTINVRRCDVGAYLAKGACIGSCFVTCDSEKPRVRHDRERSYEKSFTTYPNPATSYVKIKKEADDFEIKYIELFDLNGRLIRYVSAPCDGEITIDRQGLKSGSYFLRINGNTEYSTYIIFK